MRLLSLFCILFISVQFQAQKAWHFGVSYSFGGAWNFHPSNSQVAKPSDVSNIGLIARLENEGKSLGFQAGVHLRWNDVRNRLEEDYYLDNGFRSVELRLQCILPLSKKSSLGFGIAPRLVVQNNFSIVYSNTANGNHLESEIEIPNNNADLNELNSSLLITYQFRLHPRWHFFLTAESDIQPVYAENVKFENYDLSQNNEPIVEVNSFLTSLSGTIVFWVK